jgi:hypothetical protein
MDEELGPQGSTKDPDAADTLSESPEAVKAPEEDPIAPVPRDPEDFPRGSWLSLDYLLHNPSDVVAYIRLDRDLWAIAGTLLTFSVMLAAFYGVVMGATNILQGSEMAVTSKLLQIVATSVKVPVLFLLTLIIALPPIYVSNAFVGSHNSFRQVVTMLICATTITVTVLASTGTVALFFALTSKDYNFIKLMHVAFFAYGGVIGLGFLERCLKEMSQSAAILSPRRLLGLWILLYAFVGMQLAWILRPFIGTPDQPFSLFREREGNFYESVWHSFLSFFA